MDSISRRGMMFVLSSPSGAGKTTLSHSLLDKEQNLTLSISMTTRPQRPKEVDGQDYIFLNKDEFLAKQKRGEFLEWAEVFDHYYGTPRHFVEDALNSGKDILFDIDWQGCAQLRKILSNDLVSIFILPPSAATLEQRLRSRGQDTEETVIKRMQGAKSEMQHWEAYDYIIINDDLNKSLIQLQAILNAERLKRTRCYGLTSFVNTLLQDLS